MMSDWTILKKPARLHLMLSEWESETKMDMHCSLISFSTSPVVVSTVEDAVCPLDIP